MTNSYTLEQLWKDLKIPAPINDARGLAIDLTLKLTDTSSTSSAYVVAESKEDAFTRLRSNPPFINGKANKENVVPVLEVIYSHQEKNPVFSAVSLLVDTIKTTQKQLDALDYTTPASDEGIALFDLSLKELTMAITRITSGLDALEESFQTKSMLFHNLRAVDKEIEAAQTKKALLLGNHVPVKALKVVSAEPTLPAPPPTPYPPSGWISYQHLPFQNEPPVKFLSWARSITQRFYTHVWSSLGKSITSLPQFPGIQSYAARVLMDDFFVENNMPQGLYSDVPSYADVSLNANTFLANQKQKPEYLRQVVEFFVHLDLFEGYVDLPEHIRQFGLHVLPAHPIDFTKSRFFKDYEKGHDITNWAPTTFTFWVSFFERFGSSVGEDEDPVVTFQRAVFAKEMGRLFLQLPPH